MKKLFSLLALVLSVALVRAANPSVLSFNTNFFSVTGAGTADGSIKIRTNAFTWLNAGGGIVPPWTNIAGVIQPVSTNQIRFYPSGGISVGNNTTNENFWGAIGTNYVLVSIAVPTDGGFKERRIYMQVLHDGALAKASDVELWASMGDTNRPYSTLKLSSYNEVIGSTWQMTSGITNNPGDGIGEPRLWHESSGVFSGVTTDFRPSAIDGTTTYVMGSTFPHTSGYLVTVLNTNSLKFFIDWAGSVTGYGPTNYFAGNVTIQSNLNFAVYTPAAPTAITFPASDATWTNTTSQHIEVYIDNVGITGTAIKKNGTQILGGLITGYTMLLGPGEYFSETYSIGTPSARYSSFKF